MTVIDARRMQEIEARYPDYFRRSFTRRFGGLMIAIGTLLYCMYAVWFFDLPRLVAEARWERVGLYLVQWVSYDVQPEFRVSGDAITVKYPRFSPLGDNPHPDWIVNRPDGSVAVSVSGSSRTIEISKSEVLLTAHGMTVPVDISGDTPKVEGAVPAWMTVYDDNVIANMGISGEVSIAAHRIKIRKKFFGWPNFIFDTRSPFFDKPAGDVISMIVSGPRIEPDQSNLSLAFDNIWNNSAWQHGDVWTKLFQTIVMAFLGTLLGALAAFPLAFIAARNITPNRFFNQLLKRFFDFLRSVDMLIWALFLTRAFGPGPLAGSGAIFLTETGTLGKLYSEGLENIDNKPREGIKSTGASPILVHRFGIMPQLVPVIVSQTLYQWESNVRGATIIGAVGAGGIGLKLWEAMRTNSNWQNVAYMVVLILIVVFLFDMASNALRHRLMGTNSR
ncbi:phosphonate ABC transporter, permease protein PhnE [Rhizobium sp. BK251]|uniref:phosphonate ABC transporter, permease protein PhnE n=1 Tax=Rhizobium sp. BK251 TaxID=2512125 RepID=UPI00104755C2|nr:phosphonate ABC transporter, permease protein PhnE [Rhizobium sp. BK251]TCL71953.1 phosphonate transport system permease protein [Rhizobium sp. BK251]